MRAKKVREAMAPPFTNPRNATITSNYPLQRIQYEDADKPEEIDYFGSMLSCDRCGKPVKEGEFIDGVCKRCHDEGYYIDGFGTTHRIKSREIHLPRYT